MKPIHDAENNSQKLADQEKVVWMRWSIKLGAESHHEGTMPRLDGCDLVGWIPGITTNTTNMGFTWNLPRIMSSVNLMYPLVICYIAIENGYL